MTGKRAVQVRPGCGPQQQAPCSRGPRGDGRPPGLRGARSTAVAGTTPRACDVWEDSPGRSSAPVTGLVGSFDEHRRARHQARTDRAERRAQQKPLSKRTSKGQPKICRDAGQQTTNETRPKRNLHTGLSRMSHCSSDSVRQSQGACPSFARELFLSVQMSSFCLFSLW